MVVKASETRSERRTGDVVLDETVDIDDGGGVAKLNAGYQDEDERDHRIHRFQHFVVARFSRTHFLGIGSRVWELDWLGQLIWMKV